MEYVAIAILVGTIYAVIQKLDQITIKFKPSEEPKPKERPKKKLREDKKQLKP